MGGGREGDGEKSVSPAPKHRIVPTPPLTNIFPPVLVCVNPVSYYFLILGSTARKDPKLRERK
jgi:hypothetical protein